MRRRRLNLKTILVALLAATILGLSVSASAQRRGTTPARRPTPPPAALKKEAADITCPARLGEGIATKRTFCDVMTGRLPAEGILIPLPPHVGTVTLTFDLHNRHQYSEEQVLAKRAYARYTAVIGALTADNTLIGRPFAIQSDFRTAADLFDRVGGGAGPGGLKAVAPTGVEPITITIPEGEHLVSLLGEKLTIERLGEVPATYSSAGRPIAVVSNVMIEYRPAPPAPATPPARGRGL